MAACKRASLASLTFWITSNSRGRPGTPKDFLTYFAGLVGVRFPAMLAIATIGRVPSIITSTIAASAFGSGDYTVAIIAVIVAGLLIVGGTVAYKQVEARCKR